jgi:hemoglobin
MPIRIAESQIRDLVFTFYDRVRDDDVLGPVFEARLAGRWDDHLERMCDFWSTVLLATGRFRGNPAAVHARIPGIRPEHFDRWIELFGQTAFDVLPAPVATDVVGRSTRMRRGLERVACPRTD